MQQNSPAMNIAQKFNERFQQALAAKIFITPDISALWRKYALRALLQTPASILRVKSEEFHSLVDCAKGNKVIDLFQFATLNNNLESKSARELRLSPGKYVQVMRSVETLAAQWSAQAEVIRNELGEQIKAEAEELRKKKEAQIAQDEHASKNGMVKPITKK